MSDKLDKSDAQAREVWAREAERVAAQHRQRTHTVALMAAILVAQHGGSGGVYSHTEVAREAWELFDAVLDMAPGVRE